DAGRRPALHGRPGGGRRGRRRPGLEACHPIAAPAREALAAHVDAQRAADGPDVWAPPEARLRKSHQAAVRALARLGDTRALPSLLAALDGDVDAWRAIQ